jgi:hypothetical protein
MDVSILGGRRISLPSGWRRQTSVSLLGGSRIDAGATPGEDAKLTIVTILGGIHMKVPKGAKVSVGGFSLLGGRKVETTPGEGPEISVRAFSFLGGIHITDKEE